MGKKEHEYTFHADDGEKLALEKMTWEGGHKRIADVIGQVVRLAIRQKISEWTHDANEERLPLTPSKSDAPPHQPPNLQTDELARIRAEKSREHASKGPWSGQEWADTVSPGAGK